MITLKWTHEEQDYSVEYSPPKNFSVGSRVTIKPANSMTKFYLEVFYVENNEALCRVLSAKETGNFWF